MGEGGLEIDGLAALEADDRRTVVGDVTCICRHSEGSAYVGDLLCPRDGYVNEQGGYIKRTRATIMKRKS
jgi:hypothetical protein